MRSCLLFANRKGNVAKPLHLALGVLIIQLEYGFSDEETALMIQENPYLQYFCGFAKYEYKLPFDPSLMVHFRKRLTPSIVGEINEMIIKNAEKEDSNEDDGNSGPGGSPETYGTLIVDATCAPSYIKYPQDIELLNEARENTEDMITELHDPKDGRKPRNYKMQSRKDYLNMVRKKRKTSKEKPQGNSKAAAISREKPEIHRHPAQQGKNS